MASCIYIGPCITGCPAKPKKTLFMLKKQCGKDALRNSILVTTMWDRVDPADGDKREKQFINTPE